MQNANIYMYIQKMFDTDFIRFVEATMWVVWKQTNEFQFDLKRRHDLMDVSRSRLLIHHYDSIKGLFSIKY